MGTLTAMRLTTQTSRVLSIAAVIFFGSMSNLTAQQSGSTPVRTDRHPLYHTSLPPGAIWNSPAAYRVQPTSFQPVKFYGPEGTEFSMPNGGAMAPSEPNLMAGLMVGPVYRFRVTGIPFSPGAELYPTIELLGRLHPPAGQETRFPIPINLSESDLQNAMEGSLVTRVIYLEDPQSAAPLAKTNDDSRPIDLTPDQDALATADSLGRPIAILRIGSLAPPRNPVLAPQFYFGYPVWAPIYQSEPPTPAAAPLANSPAN
ncbi:MAG: hypothetical protein AAFU85_30415 [Planctomycetota bacterium]